MKRPQSAGRAGQAPLLLEELLPVELLARAGKAGTMLPKSAWLLVSERWWKASCGRCAILVLAAA